MQYGPNIAHYILTHAPFNTTLNLKGLAQGNAVCRRPDDSLESPEPRATARYGQDDLDMYWGKGLVSRKLYTATYKGTWPASNPRPLVGGCCSPWLVPR